LTKSQFASVLGLAAWAFGRHVLAAVLDDVENFAVGAILQSGGSVKSAIVSFMSLAVSPWPSPSFPWHLAQSRVAYEPGGLRAACMGLGEAVGDFRLLTADS
jgi:hypothetical protein